MENCSYKYICIKSICYNEDIGNYISYGIALENDRSTEIEDLSTDRAAVEALVNKINSLQLDPIHLNDAAQDFILS